MPSNVPVIAQLQKVGIAKEVAWGTAIATPAYTLRIKDIKAETSNKQVKDEGLRGVNAKLFGVYDGVHETSIDITALVFPEDIPLLIKTLLSTETVTGSTVYTHAFKLDATGQPPSLTVFHDNGFEVRVYPGCMAESLSFKWSKDGGLEASIKMKGKPFAVGSQWVPSFAATEQFIGWQTTVMLAGSSNAKMVGFDIELKRALYVQHAANNTQEPTAIVSGPIEVSGKATFDVTDDTELNYMINNTQPVLLVTMTETGTNPPSISWQMSKCAFMKDAETGKTVVEGDMSWEAVVNLTDGTTTLTPCLITVQNAVTLAY